MEETGRITVVYIPGAKCCTVHVVLHYVSKLFVLWCSSNTVADLCYHITVSANSVIILLSRTRACIQGFVFILSSPFCSPTAHFSTDCPGDSVSLCLWYSCSLVCVFLRRSFINIHMQVSPPPFRKKKYIVPRESVQDESKAQYI